MFQKQFRVKTQTAIKGSDRKKLKVELKRRYPELDDVLLSLLVPGKEEMSVMKIFTHGGENLVVYCLRKNPIFFERHGTLYPTVFTMWSFPDLLPVFTTWPPVFKKISSGADLMLPGVIFKGEVTPDSLGKMDKGTPCTVKLLGNKCPVAVGETAMSTNDMYMSALRGKGVTILHCYKDTLWAFGDKSEIPVIEDTEMLEAVRKNGANTGNGKIVEEDEEDESDGEADVGISGGAVGGADCSARVGVACSTETDHTSKLAACMAKTMNVDDQDDASEERWQVSDSEEDDADSKPIQDVMDELLDHCLLCAIKSNIKKADLPLLTSNLFRNHMLPFCPRDQPIDVKKSSYKKLSKFLASKQKDGLVKVKEMTKGVESLIEVNKEHPSLRGFSVPEIEIREACVDVQKSAAPIFEPPQITEVFIVSAATAPLFKKRGHQKGSAMTTQDIKDFLVDYVQVNYLKDPANKGQVRLDETLFNVILKRGEYMESIAWDLLRQRCHAAMSPGYRVTSPGLPTTIKKGKLDPIVFNVVQRGGKKKVTLVHNVETFGIDPQQFAHEIQITMACSASVSPLPGKATGVEVMMQGNQINFVAQLLTDKYQVPRRYLKGLDLAPKVGKKK